MINKAVPAKNFVINYKCKDIPILEAPTKSDSLDYKINNLEDCYYFVAIVGKKQLMQKKHIG
ncbi:MAG: hypothetical protein ACOCRK_08605 [bacterium]